MPDVAESATDGKLSRRARNCRVHSRGKIACLSWQTILLIDPTDWSVKVRGRFDCVGPVRDWILLGDDLYAILDTRLVRIRGFGR